MPSSSLDPSFVLPNITDLTGLPVYTTVLAFENIDSWPWKPVMTSAAPLAKSLFALPGKAFASWIITGTPAFFAAMIRGALTYPPVLITQSGLNSSIRDKQYFLPLLFAAIALRILGVGL